MNIDVTPERVFYYGVDGEQDHGWGCVYRAAQTLLCALGVSPVPRVRDMMVTLGIPRESSGRERWIEPKQVRELLARGGHIGTPGMPHAPVLVALTPDPELLLRTQVDDFQRVHSNWVSFHSDVIAHLQRTHTPVVVDDGIYGYALCGYDGPESDPQNGRYLVMDPHISEEGAQMRRIPVPEFYRRRMLMALVCLDE